MTNSRRCMMRFFDALVECGKESPWPDVELFQMGDGYAGDYWPQLVT